MCRLTIKRVKVNKLLMLSPRRTSLATDYYGIAYFRSGNVELVVSGIGCCQGIFLSLELYTCVDFGKYSCWYNYSRDEYNFKD